MDGRMAWCSDGVVAIPGQLARVPPPKPGCRLRTGVMSFLWYHFCRITYEYDLSISTGSFDMTH